MYKFQELYESGKFSELLELSQNSTSVEAKYWEIDALLLLERSEEAKLLFERYFELLEQSNNPEILFNFMHLQGIFHTDTGDIDAGRSYIVEALKIAETHKLDDFYLFRGWIDLALNYNTSGDFVKTAENAKNALRCTGTNKFRLTIVNLVLGYASSNNNDLKNAGRYFSQGLKYSKEINNHQMMSHALHGLVNAHSWLGNLESAKEYLREFTQISERSKDRLIVANYKFSKAVFLFNHPRLASKMSSLELFVQLLDEQLFSPSIEVWVYWYILELLFGEYRLHKLESVMEEIKGYIDRYYASSVKYNNIAHITISLITQAQLAGVEGEFVQAEKIISQAITIAQKYGATEFVERAGIAKERLLNEFKQMEILIVQNATLSERLNKSSLVEYLKNAQNLIGTTTPLE